MTEFELLDALLPDNLKLAMRLGYADKIAAVQTGLQQFEFKDIAQYVGTKIAERHLRNRTITNGILALNGLRED